MTASPSRNRSNPRAAGAIRDCCEKLHADAACVAECNWFVWRVADAFCRAGSHGFGASMDADSADGLIDIMRAGSGWRAVSDADPDADRRAGNIVDAAIRLAAAGNLVIAGMKSTWFAQPQAHGHVAVVIGVPGEYSAAAQHVLPCGYAGGRNAAARIPAGAHRHLGWSFPAAQWRSIGYWYRAPGAGSTARRAKVRRHSV